MSRIIRELINISLQVRRKESAVILLLFFVAFGIRFINLDWGLPGQNFPYSQYNQDETAELYTTLLISDRAYQISIIRNQPAFYYLGFAYFMLLFIAGVATGRLDNLSDFQAAFESDLSPFFMAGRILILFFSALTVVLVYKVGKYAFNKRSGLVGAIFLIVSFGHVVFSKIYRLDSLLPFLFLLSYFLIVRLKDAQPGRIRPYILCGIAIGITAATKVTGLALLLPYLLSPLIETWPWRKGRIQFPKIDRRYPFGLAVILGTYFALVGPSYLFQLQLNPDSSILDGAIVSGMVRRFSEATATGDSYALSPYRWSLPWHLSSTFPQQLGWPIFILAVVGFFVMVMNHRYRRAGIYLIVTVLALLLPVGYLRRAPWRDMVPVLPLLALSAGLALVSVVDFTFSRWNFMRQERIRDLFLVLGTGLLIFLPLIEIGRYHYLLNQPDTREIARDWIEENISGGSRIAYEPFSPDLVDERYFGGVSNLDEYEELDIPSWAAGRPRYSLLSLVPSVGGVLPADRTLIHLTDHDIEYVITSSGYYGRFYSGALDLHAPELSETGREMHDVLASNLNLVQEFVPDSQDRPGPVIKVFRVPESLNMNAPFQQGSFDAFPDMTNPVSVVGYYQFAPR